MWRARQAGHQQAAASPGTGTTAGRRVHQHGSALASAIAQPNSAPQRVQMLIKKALLCKECQVIEFTVTDRNRNFNQTVL
jgi:hypothetical protein